MQGRDGWLMGSFLLIVLSGCARVHPANTKPETAAPGALAELGQDHDPSATGTIQGRIVWAGPVPDVPPLQVFPDLTSQPDVPERQERINPHAPKINSKNPEAGVGQAMVFLRQVDLRKSRPWDHPPVAVEQRDWTLFVRQGETVSSIGLVRRGEAFTAVSKQKVLHILRGQGAGFFSLPFPDAGVVTSKRLEKTGHVELLSAADYFWMRGHLFVDDHPYYARSAADGKFVLPRVPAGTYQIVCWLPNWKITWRERDPESSVVARIQFLPPLEKERQIVVAAGKAATVDFVVTAKDFVGETAGAKR